MTHQRAGPARFLLLGCSSNEPRDKFSFWGALALLACGRVHEHRNVWRNCYAYDQPVAWANVKPVESSYTSDAVVFQIDALVANCAAGAWLRWEGGARFPRGSDEAQRQANVRAVHATLLTALAAGKRVAVHAKNSTAQDPTCVVEFLHLRND